jgi:hypothetical protein
MKVTKAKGPSTDLCGVLGCYLSRPLEERGHRLVASPTLRRFRDFIGRKSPLIHRWRLDDHIVGIARSKAADRSQLEPLDGRDRKTASQSKRQRYEPPGLPESRAFTPQMSDQIGIQALCFGDFHLCQQMKVTRPPGRDPRLTVSTVPQRTFREAVM